MGGRETRGREGEIATWAGSVGVFYLSPGLRRQFISRYEHTLPLGTSTYDQLLRTLARALASKLASYQSEFAVIQATVFS